MSTTSIAPRIPELLRVAETEWRHAETLARATGEHFNVFKVLAISHLEVKTHSPMLAELLNPKGSHGQGDTYLRLFLERPGQDFPVRGFDTASATITLEYDLGRVTDKSSGRIDIVIQDARRESIYIENKIFAQDQERQIQRYRAQNSNAHLFYLTRFGDVPNGLTTDEAKKLKCNCISYSRDILGWLKACRKESTCLPRVRETLSQYIHIIEELTNQSTSQLMNEHLKSEILRDPESLGAFFTLHAQYEAIRNQLIEQFDAELSGIGKRAGLEIEPPEGSLFVQNAARSFWTPALQKFGLRIEIGFDKKNCEEFWFGYARRNADEPSPIETELRSEFAKQFKLATLTDYVPVSAFWERGHRGWWNETLLAIKSGQFAGDLEARLRTMLEIFERACANRPPAGN